MDRMFNNEKDMQRHSIRYFFEHKLMPEGFYKEKEKFIMLLLEDKEILFRTIDDLFNKQGFINPYTADQFDIDAAKLEDDVLIVKVTFPEPEEEPLCYCSYMLFTKDLEKKCYFCIEKGQEEDFPFVCSWSPDGVHHNYGQCSFEEHDYLQRCVEMFMDND